MDNWKSKSRLARIVPAFLSVAFVLALTHLPPDRMPKTLPRVLQMDGADKVEHGISYALITASFLFAGNWRRDRRVMVILILAIAALGAADEMTQPLANRDCSGWDWTADLIGIAAGCGIVLLSYRCCRTAVTPSLAKGLDRGR